MKNLEEYRKENDICTPTDLLLICQSAFMTCVATGRLEEAKFTNTIIKWLEFLIAQNDEFARHSKATVLDSNLN